MSGRNVPGRAFEALYSVAARISQTVPAAHTPQLRLFPQLIGCLVCRVRPRQSEIGLRLFRGRAGAAISGEACGGLSRRTRAIDHLLYENLSMQRISPRRFPPPWSVRQVTREAEEDWGRH